MDTEAIAAEAADIISENPGLLWGIRVDFGDEPEPGAEAPPSRRWEDGEPTEEFLDGTSALEIRSASARRVVRALALYEKSFRWTKLPLFAVLMCGQSSEPGEDDGEIVLRRATIEAVWTL